MTIKVPMIAGLTLALIAGFSIATSLRGTKTPDELQREISKSVADMQRAQAILNAHPQSAPGMGVEPIPETVVKQMETLFIVSRRILLDDLEMLNRWAQQSKDAHTVIPEVTAGADLKITPEQQKALDQTIKDMGKIMEQNLYNESHKVELGDRPHAQ